MKAITELKQDRIEVIDVLRGFTLLGIALAHFTEQYYAGPPPKIYENFTGSALADQIVGGIVGFFISGKFFMIFSFLFGLSFFIQLSKSDGSAKFLARFTWRLFILFFIGFIHSLFYRGDILTIYAILGIGLLISYRLSDKILLILALILVFNLPTIVDKSIALVNHVDQLAEIQDDQKELETYYNTIKSGSLLQILTANSHEFDSKAEYQFFSGRIYITMGLFLLGLYAGRKNLFQNVLFFKKLTKFSLWLLLGCIVFAVAFFGALRALKIEPPQQLYWLVGGTVYDTFNAALAAIYVGVMVRLFGGEKWKNRLMVFNEAGRMGLTTYLMQSLFGTLIFFSYGLGLLGDIGNAVTAGIAIVVFTLQIVISKWWLSRYQYGPVEWLWRSLTYMKVQPMRIRQPLAEVPA